MRNDLSLTSEPSNAMEKCPAPSWETMSSFATAIADGRRVAQGEIECRRARRGEVSSTSVTVTEICCESLPLVRLRRRR